MTRASPLLLLALAAGADDQPPVAGDGKTFEIALPKGVAWTKEKAEGDTKAHLKTEFAASDPKATADVRVMVFALSRSLAEKSLETIAADWAKTLESTFENSRLAGEGKSELGGEEAWSRDLRNDWARLTWHLSRKNGFLFIFHVIRTNQAVDDADLEAEVAAMRASFRVLAEEANPEEPPPPEPPRHTPEQLKRSTRVLDYWRLELVKPEGLVEVPQEDLTENERAGDVVAKFEGRGEQTAIMVRVYAQSEAGRKFTIEKLAEQRIAQFEKAYDKALRQPPQRDTAWKPPLAERAIRLVLVGREKTVRTTRWFLAECKNGRQYQLEIYVSGGAPDRWSKEIEEVLKGFRPLKE